MNKLKMEYIWLDGYKPEANIRSKTKIVDLDIFDGDPNALPVWSFDGSSTMQAPGGSSDCLLQPVACYPDPQRRNAWLVLCEVMNPDGTPHETNYRSLIPDDTEEYWFGFEQEYVLEHNGLPMGFPDKGFPAPQGPYYCAVGYGNVAGRDIVEEHLDACLDAGLGVTGINAEVLLGQWEYQVFGKGAKKAADELTICRYLMYRISEKYNIKVNIHPKPLTGDWNGSGMHVNFSNAEMREEGSKDLFDAICESFRAVHKEHIDVYGSNNHMRLTGKHETQSINTFSYGVSDRGASIRIPVFTVQNNWKGYLEDRRPASNADPYRIVERIVKTIRHMEIAVS